MEIFPYAFARKQGVVYAPSDEEATVHFRDGVSWSAIAEAQRILGSEIRLQRVDEDAFDQILRQVYESGSKTSMDSMEGLGDNLDLFSVAEELSQPDRKSVV